MRGHASAGKAESVPFMPSCPDPGTSQTNAEVPDFRSTMNVVVSPLSIVSLNDNDEDRLVEESGSLRYIPGELCIDAISLCRL